MHKLNLVWIYTTENWQQQQKKHGLLYFIAAATQRVSGLFRVLCKLWPNYYRTWSALVFIVDSEHSAHNNKYIYLRLTLDATAVATTAKKRRPVFHISRKRNAIHSLVLTKCAVKFRIIYTQNWYRNEHVISCCECFFCSLVWQNRSTFDWSRLIYYTTCTIQYYYYFEHESLSPHWERVWANERAKSSGKWCVKLQAIILIYSCNLDVVFSHTCRNHWMRWNRERKGTAHLSIRFVLFGYLRYLFSTFIDLLWFINHSPPIVYKTYKTSAIFSISTKNIDPISFEHSILELVNCGNRSLIDKIHDLIFVFFMRSPKERWEMSSNQIFRFLMFTQWFRFVFLPLCHFLACAFAEFGFLLFSIALSLSLGKAVPIVGKM